jgi:lipid A 4'-phosphatase
MPADRQAPTRPRPARAILLHGAVFLVLALVFSLDPGIDLRVSSWFFDPASGQWSAGDAPWAERVRWLIAWAGALVPVAAILLFLAGRWLGRPIRGGDGRLALYLVLSLALGPGLLVNGILKEEWGRARPAQIVEFGRDRQFTPALMPSRECPHNCSFVSGEASLGFSFMALGWIAEGWLRPALLGFGLGLGVAIGLMRMAQGGHFLSDVLFAGVFTSFLCWALYYWLFQTGHPARLWAALAPRRPKL